MQTTTPTILSIQVGMPAQHGADAISDKGWESGIFKQPVSGAVELGTLNLAGDGQSDLQNHGGEYRAILGYSAEHYQYWREVLSRPDLAYGRFGENFTISHLTESDVCLGDIYVIGDSIRVQVSQPRAPCWKLARRNGIKDLAVQVQEKGWGGWYHRVLQTGSVQAGDTYTLLERPYPDFTIAFMNNLKDRRVIDPAACIAISKVDALTPEWRDLFLLRSQKEVDA